MSFKYPYTDENLLDAGIRRDNVTSLRITEATADSDRSQIDKPCTPTDKGFIPAYQLNFDFIILGKAKFKPT